MALCIHNLRLRRRCLGVSPRQAMWINRVLLNTSFRRKISSNSATPILMSHNIRGDSSNNPPVMIMHGILGSKNNWNSLAKAMNVQTKRQIITMDARNHGDSPHSDEFSYSIMTEDVIHLMDHLNLKTSCIIGHSMGGRTMMRVALSYPLRVEKLVVVDISPIQLSATLVIEKYLGMLQSIKLDDNLPLSQGRRVADTLLQNSVPDIDIRQFLLANLIKTDNKFRWKANLVALKNNFKNIVDYPLSDEVYEGPVLFIGGTKSDYLKSEDTDQIRSYFPRAHFKYLDTGHWVHAEQPENFMKIVANFITAPTP